MATAMPDAGAPPTILETAQELSGLPTSEAAEPAAEPGSDLPPPVGGVDLSGPALAEDALPTDEVRRWHGSRGSGRWQRPKCLAESDQLARPGYRYSREASEYSDHRDVLDGKLALVQSMLSESASTALYVGAGLSTATGVGDYASRASGSQAPHKGKGESGSRLELKPTLGHHVCAALCRKGLVHHALQQNHDRLLQKAGFPQEKINEIHGAWGDMKNPVVSFNDSLRPDLFAWLQEWTEKCEVCIALGTSLCGMNADSMAGETAQRNGLVIIGLQPTMYDEICAVRIWGLLDDVLLALAKKCGLGKVPDPLCKRSGDAWISKHPRCRYDTPKRTASAK